MAGDGYEYPWLVQRLIDLAMERYAAKAEYRG
jgi:hypothetical protein